jgi:hypothetical protein
MKTYITCVIIFVVACFFFAVKTNNIQTSRLHQLSQLEQNRYILERDNLIFHKYFPKDEVDVIISEAKENGCWNYEDRYILFAIRKQENGSSGKEFGIRNRRAWDTDLRTQAGWAAATITKNRVRYNNTGKTTNFITFFAKRWTPVKHDPQGHINFINNVTYWSNKLHSEYEEHRRLGTLP